MRNTIILRILKCFLISCKLKPLPSRTPVTPVTTPLSPQSPHALVTPVTTRPCPQKAVFLLQISNKMDERFTPKTKSRRVGWKVGRGPPSLTRNLVLFGYLDSNFSLSFKRFVPEIRFPFFPASTLCSTAEPPAPPLRLQQQ